MFSICKVTRYQDLVNNKESSGVESIRAQLLAGVKIVLGETLQLGEQADQLTESSRLLGEIPELDSMAVLSVLTALESQFGISFDDDNISAESFETVGSLVTLVQDVQD